MDNKKKDAAATASRQSIPTKNTRVQAAPKTADRDILVREGKSAMPLERSNFKIMIIAAVMIIAGFMLMLGGSSTETEFNPDIFSTRRIVIGPTIAFLGFIVMGYGIIFLPRHRRANIKTASSTEPDKE